MQIASDIIARTAAGKPVSRIRLTNRAGTTIALSDWGARWLSANVPDFRGRKTDVVEGYANPADYLTDPYYLGATVGRFANRIAGASFSIGEQIYLLEANDGRHTNHGGFSGFHAQLWDWKVLPDGVCFQLVSPDGAGGYPGKVSVTTEYRLSETNEVSVRHVAKTDRNTYLNITNHAYFNLSGTGRPVTGHILHIPAPASWKRIPNLFRQENKSMYRALLSISPYRNRSAAICMPTTNGCSGIKGITIITY